MAFKFGFNLASLNVPQEALVITRGSNELLVVDKSAAGKETVVCAQFTAHFDGNILAVQVEDRADVIKTTTSNKAARGRIGNSHDPGRSERNSVDLVGRNGVPNQQFTILGSRNHVLAVIRPMESIDLSKMAFKCAANLHLAFRGSIDTTSEVLHCEEER